MISKNFEFSEQGMTIKLECLSTASTPTENKSSNVINIYAKQSSGYVIRSGRWYGTLTVDNVKQDFNVTLSEVSLNYVLVYTTTKEINHQADGSKLLPVSFSVTSSVKYTVKGSASFSLESINRLYKIEYNGRLIGLDNPLPVETDIVLNVHQYVDSWKLNIKTEFNGQIIWEFDDPEIPSEELSVNFPSELLPITSTYYDGITHFITYDSDNNVVGELAYPLRLRIPDDSTAIISSCIIQPVSTNEWLANKNIFVQGYSIPKVTVSGVGSWGSEITQIGIRYPSQYEILWGNATEVTGNKFITDSDDVTITVYVKDSRGIVSIITRVIFVEAYTAPYLSVELVPSNSATTVRSSISFQTFSQSSILQNSVTQRIYSNSDVIDEVVNFTGSSLSRTIGLLSTSPIYVVLEDKLGNSDLYTNASGSQGSGTDSNAVHYTADSNKTSTEKAQARTNIGLENVDNTSDLNKPISTATQTALNAKQNSTDISLTTTSKTVVGAINELAGKVFPVGAIYLSVTSTSPASLFGGTWERIKDRFLLGAGDIYSEGTTGGEATHTLTGYEIPSHTHGFPANPWAQSGGYGRVTAGAVSTANMANLITSTLSAGGGQAHNNMPPYLTVYLWERTA